MYVFHRAYFLRADITKSNINTSITTYVALPTTYSSSYSKAM